MQLREVREALDEIAADADSIGVSARSLKKLIRGRRPGGHEEDPETDPDPETEPARGEEGEVDRGSDTGDGRGGVGRTDRGLIVDYEVEPLGEVTEIRPRGGCKFPRVDQEILIAGRGPITVTPEIRTRMIRWARKHRRCVPWRPYDPPGGGNSGFEPPPEVSIGTPTIEIEPTGDGPGDWKITMLETGQVISTYGQWHLPLVYPEAEAIRRARPGDVILLKGDRPYPGCSIGGGSLGKQFTATWNDSDVIRDVALLGEGKDTTRVHGGYSFWGNLGGVDGFRLEGLGIFNNQHAYAPLMTAMNNVVGLITGYDLHLGVQSRNGYGGYGMKWACRAHGPAQWDLRRVTFEPAQEHSFYGDNFQGDSVFVDLEVLPYADGLSNGRTFLQMTNRQQSGPSQFGDILVLRCIARGIHEGSGGGSDFTLVGCRGLAAFVDCESHGAQHGQLRSNGAIVAWTDKGHGAYLTPTGYSHRHVIVSGFKCDHPNANRNHAAFSGVEKLEILDGFEIKGNRTAICLDTPWGGGIDNGTVEIERETAGAPLSGHSGFQSGVKMSKGTRNLTNPEIDAYGIEPNP